MNKLKPTEIGKCVNTQIYFKCEKGTHSSESTRIADITSSHKLQSYKCRMCGSFGQWCIDTSEFELLNRWDYDKNGISPFKVTFRSGKKYYFKCPDNNHKSEEKLLTNIVKQPNSRECKACSSFAEWGKKNLGEDFLEKYWSEENTVDPYEISPTYGKKVYINCQEIDYHHVYDITCGNFVAGKRCSYCAGKKVHKLDSLGFLHPEVLDIWDVSNVLTPYDYLPSSNKKVNFKCNKHGVFPRVIVGATVGEFRCPQCVAESRRSILQIKTSNYLSELGYNTLHENSCTLRPVNPKTQYPLPYDNEIVELKLIIEVHGAQHYKTGGFIDLSAKASGQAPEYELRQLQYRDKFKRNYVLEHGYFYLELPYWTFDKEDTYKNLIDEKINIIKKKSA